MLTPVRAPPPGRAGWGCSHRPLVGRVRPTRPGPSPYPYPAVLALSLLAISPVVAVRLVVQLAPSPRGPGASSESVPRRLVS